MCFSITKLWVPYIKHIIHSIIMFYYFFKFFYIYIFMHLADAFNRTHDLGVASAMLYYLSYRKAYLN